jgi:hypothetical protein
MSCATSPASGRPYGLAAVCRVWRLARSGVYRHQAPPPNTPPKRRGPTGGLLSELRELATPGRCLIVYHHHTRRKGGHHGEIEHWTDRLRDSGFATVDALRARPYSPRVFFLLNATADIRQRAKELEAHWQGRITWHPNPGAEGDEAPGASLGGKLAFRAAAARPPALRVAMPPPVPSSL